MTTLEKLTTNLKSKHHLPVVMKEASFDSLDRFLEWKQDLEKEKRSQYVLNCAPINKQETIVSYFYCNQLAFTKLKVVG